MKKREILEQILLRAAEVMFPDRRPKVLDVRIRDSDGDTVLHKVALWGDRYAASLLIESGAEIDAKGDMGCTPLYFAVMGGHVGTAKLLLNLGADPDAQTNLGFSPRALALSQGKTLMVRLFKQKPNKRGPKKA